MQPKVDALVSENLVTSRAAKQATKTIPIIMVTNQDTIRIVDSLERPGANITGLTTLSRDLSGKTAGFAQGGNRRHRMLESLGRERTRAGYRFEGV